VNRRAHIRYPVHINAMISNADQLPQPCFIRDYCEGGMFLSIDNPTKFSVASTLSVQFAVPIDQNTQQYQLKANAARVFEHGIGITFIDPDAKIIALLNQLVRQTQSASISQHTLAPQNQTLIQALSTLTHQHVNQLFQVFCKAAEDAFFSEAEQARDNVTQNQYFDALTQLNKGQNKAKIRFIQMSEDNFTHIERLQPTPSKYTAKNPSLSLIQKNDFEDWLVISSITAKVESIFRKPLDDLHSQLSQLYQQDIHDSNNPIGPAAICYQLHNAFMDVFQPEVLPRFYQALADPLAEGLKPLYADAISLLNEHQIISQNTHSLLERSVEEHLAHFQSVYERQFDTAPTPQADAEPPTEDATTEHASTENRNDDTDKSALAFYEAIKHLVSQQQADTATQPKTAHRLDVIQRVFDNVQHNGHSNNLKVWFKQLQAPIIASALESPRFFQDTEHPTRRAIHHLYQLSLSSGTSATSLSIKHETEHLIAKISEQNPSASFEHILPALEALVMQQTDLYNHNVDLVVKSCIGKQKLQQAHQQVQHSLATIINNRPIPHVLASLIEQSWENLLELLYLRQGHTSGPYQQYLSVVDQICTQQPGHISQHTQAALLSNIEAGLSLISADIFQNNILLDDMATYLSGTTPSSATQHTTYQSIDTHFTPEYQDALQQVRQLHINDWVLFTPLNQPGEALKLVWRDDDGTSYVFVNAQGMGAKTLAFEQLVIEVHLNIAQKTDNPADPMLDRALNNTAHSMSSAITFAATHDTSTGLMNEHALKHQLKQQCINIQQTSDIKYLLAYLSIRPSMHSDTAIKKLIEFLKDHLDKKETLAYINPRTLGLILSAPQNAETTLASLQTTLQTQQQLATHIGAIEINSASRCADDLCQAASEAHQTACTHEQARHLYLLSPADIAHQQRIQHWANCLQTGLDNNALMLRYQRRQAITSKTLKAHYEIRLALKDDTGAFIESPILAQALAHDHKPEIDRWMIQNIFTWIQQNPKKIAAIGRVAIPLCRYALHDKSLVNFIQTQLDSQQISAHLIVFEATESAILTNIDSACEVINALKNVGCEFTLSEFGSNVASYTHLKTLPVDYVKLDRTFMLALTQNQHDQTLIQSIHDVAHILGKLTIADSVEDDATLAVLREVGVDFAQGDGIEKARLLETP